MQWPNSDLALRTEMTPNARAFFTQLCADINQQAVAFMQASYQDAIQMPILQHLKGGAR